MKQMLILLMTLVLSASCSKGNLEFTPINKNIPGGDQSNDTPSSMEEITNSGFL